MDSASEYDEFEGVNFDSLYEESGGALHDRAARAVAASISASSHAAAAAQGLIVVDGAIPVRFRSVFPYETLNRVQSRVFGAVFHHDESVAVAAPTGTGKTAIFELAMVRALLQRDSLPSCRDAKFVYLAPLRALCAERRTDWQRKFAPLGLRVACVTGDADGDVDESPDEGHDDGGAPVAPPPRSSWSHDTDREAVSQADIIITTPEKWDSMTRRWRDNTSLIRQIVLLCLDEVHLLGDDRGAVLEAVVARMHVVAHSQAARDGDWPAGRMRIVAVSATLPNVGDVGRWIGAPPQNSFSFDASFRPVPLTVHVNGYDFRAPNAFLFEKYLETRVYEVVAAHSTGRPTLVFCASRNGTRTTAECLVKDALIHGPRLSAQAYGQAHVGSGASAAVSAFLSGPAAQDALARCIQAAGLVKDKRLADCLRHGVGYHSAGETGVDRAAMERLFGEGSLPVLCTTTTLAMGVNLPAHLVVIKSTQAWRGAGQGYTEYPVSQLLQMMGRAGRPQFDTSGTAVIMTHVGTQGLYRSVTSGTTPVESTLGASLVEHVVSEVTLRTVTSVETGMDLLRSTFLNIRMRSNPAHYRVPGSSASNVDAHMKQMLTMQLFAMHQAGLIQLFVQGHAHESAVDAALPRELFNPSCMQDLRAAGNVQVEALAPAHIMSRNYLRFETMVLLTTIGRDSSVIDVLIAMCRAREIVSSLVLRRDEKKMLRDIKEKQGRVPCKKGVEGTVSTVHDKAFQLVQAGLGRIKLDNKTFNMRMEMNAVLDSLKRITKAFLQYCAAPGVRSTLLPVALVASRVVLASLWENADGPKLLLQLPGVTEAIVVLLASIGVASPDDLLKLTVTPAALDSACRKSHPFGQLLKAAALATLPRLSVSVSQRSIRQADGAAMLRLTVSDVTHKLPSFGSAPAADSALTLKPPKGAAPKVQLDIRDFMREAAGSPAAAADRNVNDPHEAAAAATLAAQRARTDVPPGGRRGGYGGHSGPRVHSYHLCLTTGDDDEGLIFDVSGVTEPTTFDVAVPRPGRGPRVHIHLVHASQHGLDVRLLVEPKFGANAIPKASKVTHPLVATAVAAATACPDSEPETEAETAPKAIASFNSPHLSPRPTAGSPAIVAPSLVRKPGTLTPLTPALEHVAGAALTGERNDDGNLTACDEAMAVISALLSDAIDPVPADAAEASARDLCVIQNTLQTTPSPQMSPALAPTAVTNVQSGPSLRRRKPGLTRRPLAAPPDNFAAGDLPAPMHSESFSAVGVDDAREAGASVLAITTPPPVLSAWMERKLPVDARGAKPGAMETFAMADEAMAALLGDMCDGDTRPALPHATASVNALRIATSPTTQPSCSASCHPLDAALIASLRTIPTGFEDDAGAIEIMMARRAMGLDGTSSCNYPTSLNSGTTPLQVAASTQSGGVVGAKRPRTGGASLLDAVQAQCAGKATKRTAGSTAIMANEAVAESASAECIDTFATTDCGGVDAGDGLRVLAAWTGGRAYVDTDAPVAPKVLPLKRAEISARVVAPVARTEPPVALPRQSLGGLPHAIAGLLPSVETQESIERLHSHLRESNAVRTTHSVAAAMPDTRPAPRHSLPCISVDLDFDTDLPASSSGPDAVGPSAVTGTSIAACDVFAFDITIQPTEVDCRLQNSTPDWLCEPPMLGRGANPIPIIGFDATATRVAPSVGLGGASAQDSCVPEAPASLHVRSVVGASLQHGLATQSSRLRLGFNMADVALPARPTACSSSSDQTEATICHEAPTRILLAKANVKHATGRVAPIMHASLSSQAPSKLSNGPVSMLALLQDSRSSGKGGAVISRLATAKSSALLPSRRDNVAVSTFSSAASVVSSNNLSSAATHQFSVTQGGIPPQTPLREHSGDGLLIAPHMPHVAHFRGITTAYPVDMLGASSDGSSASRSLSRLRRTVVDVEAVQALTASADAAALSSSASQAMAYMREPHAMHSSGRFDYVPDADLNCRERLRHDSSNAHGDPGLGGGTAAPNPFVGTPVACLARRSLPDSFQMRRPVAWDTQESSHGATSRADSRFMVHGEPDAATWGPAPTSPHPPPESRVPSQWHAPNFELQQLQQHQQREFQQAQNQYEEQMQHMQHQQQMQIRQMQQQQQQQQQQRLQAQLQQSRPLSFSAVNAPASWRSMPVDSSASVSLSSRQRISGLVHELMQAPAAEITPPRASRHAPLCHTTSTPKSGHVARPPSLSFHDAVETVHPSWQREIMASLCDFSAASNKGADVHQR